MRNKVPNPICDSDLKVQANGQISTDMGLSQLYYFMKQEGKFLKDLRQMMS